MPTFSVMYTDRSERFRLMRPFDISDSFDCFNVPYPLPADLLQAVKSSCYLEKLGVVRQWLSEGVPYAFRERPILYEMIREWLGSEISVHPKTITLIGSGRIGYSLAPPPDFGRPFDPQSDLDFSAVTNSVFDQCVEAFARWRDDYSEGNVSPNNPRERYYWDHNLKNVPQNIQRGFIDHWKIPLRPRYHIAQKIENAMWKLTEKLKVTQECLTVKKASIRIYKDWNAFTKQLAVNLDRVVMKI